MAWAVILDDDFTVWLFGLDDYKRKEILKSVVLLRERGPQLGRPYVDTVKGSAFSNMKELRIQIAGDPWRVLFAFDPIRSAILLEGGNKRGDKRWYETHVPIADMRFQQHLNSLKP